MFTWIWQADIDLCASSARLPRRRIRSVSSRHRLTIFATSTAAEPVAVVIVIKILTRDSKAALGVRSR
jgi:hypothetical protein